MSLFEGEPTLSLQKQPKELNKRDMKIKTKKAY